MFTRTERFVVQLADGGGWKEVAEFEDQEPGWAHLDMLERDYPGDRFILTCRVTTNERLQRPPRRPNADADDVAAAPAA